MGQLMSMEKRGTVADYLMFLNIQNSRMFKMLKNDPLHVPESIFGRMHTGAKLGF